MHQQRIEALASKEVVRACSNCEHYLHLAGVGGGSCAHPAKRFCGETSLKLMLIPAYEYSCECHELTE